MKTITSQLQAHLESETTTLATLWRVTRVDGTEFFFTDHDEDITFEGNSYESSFGYNRSAVDSKAGMAVDNLNVVGFMDSSAITENDLRAGKFDFAEVRIGIVNWKDLSQGQMKIKRGTLGQVKYSEVTGSFNAELRGLTQLLSQGAVELYQAECRADLGDNRCKVGIQPDLLPLSTAVTVGQFYRIPETPLNFECVQLQLPFDGADAATSTTDQSLAARTVTFNGDAQLDTAQMKFGTASLLLDGTGDYLTVADDTEFADLGGAFTLELHFRYASAPDATIRTLLSHWLETGDERGWTLTVDDTNVVFTYSTDGTSGTEAAVTLAHGGLSSGTWYHLALTRDSAGDIRGFLDGTQIGADTAADVTINDSTGAIGIGAEADGSLPFDGHLDNVRITTGFARYTSAFTAPTAAYASAVEALADFTIADWKEQVYKVTTAGTTGPCRETPDTTPDNTHTQGTATLTAQESFLTAFTVDTVTSNRSFTVTFPNGADSREADDWYKYGAVIWETGDNAGTAMEVKAYTASSNTIELFLAMPLDIEVGDTGGVYAGCDKRLVTCIDKFDNVLNYRGEPYVPGQDEYLSYPDAR